MSACWPSLGSSSTSADSPRLPGRCTGERCCQSIIPPTLNFYVPRMFNFENGTVDAELRGSTTPCRYKRKLFEQNGGVILQQQMHSGGGARGFKIFSAEELTKATNNFTADRVLGRGGHGVIYKGVLEDDMVVAIKKSRMMEEAQTKEFAREMFILSQINHRNVVKLLGCCLEVEVPMLVYEFVSNGTLYHYIHGKEPKADIALDTRLRIAAESAEALSYMNSSASPPILHGDLTDKSDVYSFGVVVLELLTMKKALYLDGPEEDRSLVSCFTTAVKAGRHQELLDSQVRNEMNDEMLTEIAHLLMRCLSMSGEERPTMKEVAERLEMLRRYQQYPWAEAGGNPEESQSLLGIEQQDLERCAMNFLDR
ncbi:hypothetical protein E2562_018550 [Oryza meyeriana var. granulata]|uniref:Protein kinase domain-containing protein n=1 Tax=Oryza meyeriana var. granulata TaxID=110450 RepID=A0A6G1F9C0_9ORYZ|nr:hypothetical protein E2562_018550 [Oryza meyeriana var. granulata]